MLNKIMLVLRKVVIIALIVIITTSIFAQKSIKIPAEYRRVADYGEALTFDERNLLDNILDHRSAKNSIDMFCITVKEYYGNSISEYAKKLVTELNIGNNYNGAGILILIRPKTVEKKGEIYILQSNDNGIIPDITLKLIIENEIIPFFKVDEIFEGLYNGITVIDQLLNNYFNYTDLKQINNDKNSEKDEFRSEKEKIPEESNVIVVKGKIVNALTYKPLINAQLTINGLDIVHTDNNGCFFIKKLNPNKEYFFTIKPEGYSENRLRIKTNNIDRLIETNTLISIPTPPSTGVFVYSKEKYTRLIENEAFRYYLTYRDINSDRRGIAQSGDGRLTAWYLKSDSNIETSKVVKGDPIVIWKLNSESTYLYSSISPLYYQDRKTVKGNKCGDVEAIIPEGIYLGIDKITIGDYNQYCYAPIDYSVKMFALREMRLIEGQGFYIFYPYLDRGKYAIINSSMDFDKNTDYAIVDGIYPSISINIPVIEIFDY